MTEFQISASLRQIRYFIAVARSGSFSAAARLLNVSQPALTLQIKQMERCIGTPLLARHPRGVSCTNAGAEYLQHAGEGLECLERAEQAAAAFRKDLRPRLTIGLTPTSGREMIVDLLTHSKQRRPPVDLQVREGVSDDLWPLVRTGVLDAAVCFDPELDESVKITPLCQEDLVLVGSPDLVECFTPHVTIPDLGALPLVLSPRDHRARRLIETAAQENGVDLSSALEIAPTRLKREMLVHHKQCSIVPYGLFLDDIKSAELGFRPIVPPITRTMTLIVNRSVPPSLERYLVGLTKSLVAKKIKSEELGWRRL